MKKTVAVLIIILTIGLAAFFFFFQELVPGGYAYEELNDTVTIYESYDTPVDSFQENEDYTVDLTISILKNTIDQQLVTLLNGLTFFPLLFVLIISKDKITSRYYAEMSGKVLFWFLLSAVIAIIAFFVYSYTESTQDIETWIDYTNTFIEESERQ